MNESLVEKIAQQTGYDLEKVKQIVAGLLRELDLHASKEEHATIETIVALCSSNFGSEAGNAIGRILVRSDDEVRAMMNYQDQIISGVSGNACKQIAKEVIASLDGRPMDSQTKYHYPLKTLWDGICIEVQYKKSEQWQSHLDIIRTAIWDEVKGLREEVIRSIWLQTDAGQRDNRLPPGQVILASDPKSIVGFVLRESILSEAEGWKNKRIERFLRSKKEKATKASKAVAGTVIRNLQKMKDGMQSGDDSGLKNEWDEICAQVQGEESPMYEAYMDTVTGLIQGELKQIDSEIKIDIWLQTQEGEDWTDDNNEKDLEEQEPVGYSEEDIVEYILRDLILSKASDWTNKRIERYIGSQQVSRFDDDLNG